MKPYVGMALLALLAAGPVAAQAPGGASPAGDPPAREGRWGVGAQFTWPTYGVSGMYDLTDEWSVQGVLGTAGFGLAITARGIYRLDREEQYRPYVYGEAGTWSDYRPWGTIPHFGFGGGVEADVRDFIEDAPPLYVSFEAGLNLAIYRDADLGDGTLLRLQLGPAVHYRF
jgi:hypothetical protein